MTVLHLQPLERPVLPVDEDLTEGLRELLCLAEEGKIQGIAYVTIASPGAGSYTSVGTGWRGAGVDTNVHTVLGAVAILSARLVAEKGRLS